MKHLEYHCPNGVSSKTSLILHSSKNNVTAINVYFIIPTSNNA